MWNHTRKLCRINFHIPVNFTMEIFLYSVIHKSICNRRVPQMAFSAPRITYYILRVPIILKLCLVAAVMCILVLRLWRHCPCGFTCINASTKLLFVTCQPWISMRYVRPWPWKFVKPWVSIVPCLQTRPCHFSKLCSILSWWSHLMTSVEVSSRQKEGPDTFYCQVVMPQI
jgi:hypothetical protein